MIISAYPSQLSLPLINPGVVTVFEYLVIKFPHVSAQMWHHRMLEGKVHRQDGSLITSETLFHPQLLIYYYREVESEPSIPFHEKIIFQDQHILIAFKPHFLPVTPGGVFVNECLQNRLRKRTGINTLQALHRLDRVTAGLVMFSVNPETRHCYHRLFETRNIHKTYQALAKIDNTENIEGKTWIIKNRIEKGIPRFRMEIVDGHDNSHSVIRCLTQMDQKGLFELTPITGKTHQLRVHMQSLGWPILNDKYYPVLQPLSDDNYSAPLQLLATKLRFTDPITQQERCFCYDDSLVLTQQKF